MTPSVTRAPQNGNGRLTRDRMVTYCRSMGDAEADVFRAIADPGRRALMDALFEHDGQSIVELCDVLPDMTRFGVMKHLGILADANLVVTEKVGRSKLHYLNPVPIQQIHDRWIAKYAQSTTETLTELSRRLSSTGTHEGV